MNFKKITAIGTSVLIAGMTMGLAAAASYPAPFVENGAGNFAVVYGTGTGVSSYDLTNAESLSEALSAKVTSTVGLGEEKIQISAPGTDLTYDLALSSVKEKITSTHLPTLLADRKIRDNTGVIDYEQWLEMGAHKVAFAALGDEEDYKINTDLAATLSPVVHINEATADAWQLIVEFDEAFNFTTVRDGESLVIAGKEYAVAKDIAAADTELVLYASSQTEIIPATETKTVVIDGVTYTIYVEGANTDAETAVIQINGKTESVSEGDTIYVGDQEFYINRIFMQTVPTATASVEIFVGAEKLTIPETLDTVQINGKDVDGVKSAITGTNMDTVTKITFTFTPTDMDLDTDESNYLEIGESIVDPVFGTIALSFDSASMDLMDEEKDVIEFKRVAEELQITFTNRNGDEYSYKPLTDAENGTNMTWHADLYKDTSGAADLAEHDFFLAQEGSTTASYISRIVEVTDISADEITFEDISTGDSTTLADTEELWTTGLNVRRVSSGVWDFNAETLPTVIYTESNANFTVPYTDTNTATMAVTVQEQYDVPAKAFVVTLTPDSTSDGEFAITLDGTDGDWNYAADDEGNYGYYLSAFGTYAEAEEHEDTLVTFYIPSEEVTYNVYVGATAAEGAVETGAILVMDSEVASVATKNLIVVGGSCINSAAAALVGGKLCGDAWTAKTNAGVGKYLIKGYASDKQTLTSKLAVLVAGYDVADTTNAVTYFKNKPVDTSGAGVIGTTAILATPIVETA